MNNIHIGFSTSPTCSIWMMMVNPWFRGVVLLRKSLSLMRPVLLPFLLTPVLLLSSFTRLLFQSVSGRFLFLILQIDFAHLILVASKSKSSKHVWKLYLYKKIARAPSSHFKHLCQILVYFFQINEWIKSNKNDELNETAGCISVNNYTETWVKVN